MSYFSKLPAWLRVMVTATFLVAAVVMGIIGRPSVTLAVASFLLLASGAWRLSRIRIFMLLLILIPLLIGFLLAGADWHHPFIARYSAGLFSVIAVLLLMDAVRIEEWIAVVRKNSKKLRFADASPVLIGTAVGIVSLSASIQEQRACRKLAGIYRWRVKSRTSTFLDSMSLPFYSAVESHEFIDEALRRWGSSNRDAEKVRRPELTFGNSIFTARLTDLHNFPYFNDLARFLSASSSLPEPWRKALAGLPKGRAALIIGGHFPNPGMKVTVLQGIRCLHSLSGCFDSIFFFQNAFLEALDEMGLGVLLKKISGISKPEARIYFTYPAVESITKEGTIFAGNIPGVGDVDYRYTEYERTGEIARAQLAYTIRQAQDCYCVRTPLQFRMPALSTILACAQHVGLNLQVSSAANPAPFSFQRVEVD